MVSLFIIHVQPQLQPDPNEESAALLRVLIYKTDNTAFGNNVPTLPQWTGPPQSIVLVQCLLYASLATSLLAGFLAILGKQWLNRYASIYLWGSTFERSQNRQEKLDGVLAWYLDFVLESLSLLPQVALLLLGYALTRYLWDINTTVASVVLATTSFGVLLYLLIIVAGATSDSCPYQVPGSCLVRRWARSTRPIPGQVFNDKATKLDFRCSFWMLQISSDKAIKVTTLNFLGTILSLAGFNSSINSAVVAGCFNIFSGCFVTRDDGVAVVTRGSEQLAGISAMCLLRAFSSLSIMEPASAVIRNVRQQYARAFPSGVDLRGLPRPTVISAVHHLFAGPRDRTEINWRNYNPTIDELIPFSRALAQAAQSEYHRGGGQLKVPQWLICFALRFLSQGQLPPTSVVVDCLTIIAIDLGCALPDGNRRATGERYIFTSKTIVFLLLIFHQGAG